MSSKIPICNTFRYWGKISNPKTPKIIFFFFFLEEIKNDPFFILPTQPMHAALWPVLYLKLPKQGKENKFLYFVLSKPPAKYKKKKTRNVLPNYWHSTYRTKIANTKHLSDNKLQWKLLSKCVANVELNTIKKKMFLKIPNRNNGSNHVKIIFIFLEQKVPQAVKLCLFFSWVRWFQ